MAGVRYGFRLEVTSALPADLGRIPMSVEMDFGRAVQEVEATGVFDPNSIEIEDVSRAHAQLGNMLPRDCRCVRCRIMATE